MKKYSKFSNGNDIGEHRDLLNYIYLKYEDKYQEIFKEFMEFALADRQKYPLGNLKQIGNSIINLNISKHVFYEQTSQRKERLSKNTTDVDISTTANKSDIEIPDLDFYITGNVDKGFSETKFDYENDYIIVKCYNHSNKWLDAKHTCMEKMWSIIFENKKTLEQIVNLQNWKQLTNIWDINITNVQKGKYSGFYGIRIRGLKRKPTSEIIKNILDYIFQ